LAGEIHFLGVIFAGVRVATVIAVGVATIAAAIGAGGWECLFSEYIDAGLSIDSAGAIPAALIALTADFALSATEKYFMREKRS
jgi:osmoprotectant transport system permease protein